MMITGLILVVTAVELTQNDLEIIKTTVDPGMIEVVWLGEDVVTDIAYDLHIPHFESELKVVSIVKELLQRKGIIFKPW